MFSFCYSCCWTLNTVFCTGKEDDPTNISMGNSYNYFVRTAPFHKFFPSRKIVVVTEHETTQIWWTRVDVGSKCCCGSLCLLIKANEGLRECTDSVK